MADDINYAEQPVPDNKPAEEYSYVERRAELYRMLEEAGHPRNLGRSQRELGDRYGVSQRQISKDLERLREFRERHTGSRAVASTEFIAEKAVREAAERGDWGKALERQLEYNDWLFDLGAIDREPDKLEVSGDPEEAYLAMMEEMADEENDGPVRRDFPDDTDGAGGADGSGDTDGDG